MATKERKSITNSSRNTVLLTFEELTKNKPEKSLVVKYKKNSGRNNQGRITCRHKGGGSKKFYRLIDFKRDKDNIPAKVQSIEYDPNRSAFISLLAYNDGEKRYILAPKGIKVDDELMSGPQAEIKIGNSLPISNIPIGTVIHNIELVAGKGAQIVRSAGSSAQIVAKEGEYAVIKMPSSELRLVRIECRATIGVVSNEDYGNTSKGKAGRNRWLGIRPTVRGSAMNPNDHPHGGGEGCSPIGHASPRSPWGWKTLGKKTRKDKKPSGRLITRRRNK